ncbi:MAG TPA: HEAT repeat domain-containing protein, partial [Candidatus Hydrogenedentes bacterium]|nr:HEAT repeat domain-containing protein [Candidatus Hydrogenedentota bacterium]
SAVYIINTLNWDDPSPAFAPLRALLTHKEDTTRGMAALALGAIRDAGAYDTLVRLLADDPSAYTRRCVAFALGDMMNTDALVPLKAAKEKSVDPLVSGNIDNAVDRLTFLIENEAAEAKAKAVVEGIWIIAGTAPQQKERIERAMKCINSADEATRKQVYANAIESPSQFVRNSVMFAALKNGETITVDEKDQKYFEIIRNIVGE